MVQTVEVKFFDFESSGKRLYRIYQIYPLKVVSIVSTEMFRFWANVLSSSNWQFLVKKILPNKSEEKFPIEEAISAGSSGIDLQTVRPEDLLWDDSRNFVKNSKSWRRT